MSIGHYISRLNLFRGGNDRKASFRFSSNPRWFNYVAAALIALLAIGLRFDIYPAMRIEFPMFAFVLAVIAASYIGGAGPGLMVTAILAANFLLFEPKVPVGEIRHLHTHVLVLILEGCAVSLFSGIMHSSQRRSQLISSELEESNRRIMDILASITDCYMRIDRQWRICDLNDRAAAFFGKQRTEMEGENFWEMFLVETTFEGQFRKAMDEKRAVHMETPFCPQGASWAEVHAYPVPDGLSIYFRDITDRKHDQEALAESESKFRTLAESARAIFGIVQGTRFIYVNPYLAEMSGYSREELLSLDIIDLTHPDYRPMIIDYARRRQTGQPVPSNYEFAMVTKSGQTRYLDFSAGTIEYKGKPAIIGAAYDITDRKRAEENLRISEERLRLAAEAADVATWDWDLVNDKLQWSEMGKTLFGLPSEAEVTYSLFLNTLHPEDRERVKRSVSEAIASEKEYVNEHRIVWPDGSVHWIMAKGRAIYGAAGKPLRMAGVAMDVTHQKRVEEQLKAAKEKAEAGSRAKDDFLATLSHELRTPLTPVLATASARMMEQGLSPEIREDLEMIRHNVELEARLIDDLLDLTRIVRGKFELQRENIDVYNLLNHAIQTCSRDMESKRLHVVVHTDAMEHWVYADPARLEQVFWNLLKNSIKFTPEGGQITITTQNVPVMAEIACHTSGTEVNGALPLVESSHSSLAISIADTGIGIEPEAMSRLFNAFEQQDRSVTRRFGGLGLGLAICKAILNLHGGSISAESEGKDRGAIFTIHLSTVQEIIRSRETVPLPQYSAANAASHELRILLVEDHADTARILSQLLVRKGYHVRVAGDIASALDIASREQFDLVVSDLGLPDGSGLELMPRLHAIDRAIRGIALSGYGREEDVYQSKQAGFQHHLIKPVNFQRLDTVIRDVVSGAVSQ